MNGLDWGNHYKKPDFQAENIWRISFPVPIRGVGQEHFLTWLKSSIAYSGFLRR